MRLTLLRATLALTFGVVAAAANAESAAAPTGPFGLDLPDEAVSDRVSITRGIGANRRETWVDLDGPGCINHLWITLKHPKHSEMANRKIVLRIYFDGAEVPHVEAPVGDFFGVGHGWVANFQCCALNMSTSKKQFGGRAAMNCFFQMPFRKSARIEIENPCEVPVRSFYFYIDYQVWKDLPDVAHFHAKWRRENPCDGWQGEGSTWHSPDWQKRMRGDDGVNLTGDGNYLILDAEGRGHFVGVVLSIHNLYQGWWGEGDDMMFVDGEGWPPSLHGTGTEDYFCHAWGMQNNRHLYNGVSLWAEPPGPPAAGRTGEPARRREPCQKRPSRYCGWPRSCSPPDGSTK